MMCDICKNDITHKAYVRYQRRNITQPTSTYPFEALGAHDRIRTVYCINCLNEKVDSEEVEEDNL